MRWKRCTGTPAQEPSPAPYFAEPRDRLRALRGECFRKGVQFSSSEGPETLEAKLATKALRPSRERWRVGER